MHTGNNYSPHKEVNNNDNKYGYLKSLDTAKLQALLQQESFFSADDKLDVDLIQHIMAILDEREPVSEEPDVEESLKVFKKEIMPELEKEIIEVNSVSFAPLSAAPRPKSMRRRFATILIAAIVSILLGGTLVASAFGYNIWKYVISWGKETFQIGSGAQVTAGPSVTPLPQSGASTVKSDKYQTLDEAVVALNADILTPKWIPDGFELDGVAVLRGSERKSLTAVYKADGSTIVFSAVIYSTQEAAYVYEIDENSGETITIAGNTCYTMTNIDQAGIVWIDKDIVYSINGNTGRDELTEMVNLIYEGEA